MVTQQARAAAVKSGQARIHGHTDAGRSSTQKTTGISRSSGKRGERVANKTVSDGRRVGRPMRRSAYDKTDPLLGAEPPLSILILRSSAREPAATGGASGGFTAGSSEPATPEATLLRRRRPSSRAAIACERAGAMIYSPAIVRPVDSRSISMAKTS